MKNNQKNIMLRTYNAVLTGNHLEWKEDTPEQSDRP